VLPEAVIKMVVGPLSNMALVAAWAFVLNVIGGEMVV
jgi:hypothetical protein